MTRLRKMGESPRRFWSSDKLFSIAAIIVSAGTLFIIVYQTRLIQKQQYASVLPYLEIWNNQPYDSTYNLTLINNGIGPAFIEQVEVVFEDSSYIGDQEAFYRNHIAKVDPFIHGHSNLAAGNLVPAGKSKMLITTRDTTAARKARHWFGGRNAKLKIIYSSVYGERWEIIGHSSSQKLDN